MFTPTRRISLLRVLGILGSLVLGLSCVSAARMDPVQIWAKGPVRWLILPAEWRLLKRVKGSVQLAVFVEDFWRRRNPNPRDNNNAFLQEFQRRNQVANRLYGGESSAGGLTERGRVLILLGEPTGLRKTHRKVLSLGTFDSSKESRSRPTRLEPVEVWTYPIQDLPSALQAEMMAKGLAEIQIEFVKNERGDFEISEGEKWLKRVVKHSVRPPRRVSQ